MKTIKIEVKDFEDNWDKYFPQVESGETTFILCEKGKPQTVLMSYEQYQETIKKLEEEIEESLIKMREDNECR